MKLRDALLAGTASLPATFGVGRLAWLLSVATHETGRRRWGVPVATAITQWAMVTTLLALLLAS